MGGIVASARHVINRVSISSTASAIALAAKVKAEADRVNAEKDRVAAVAANNAAALAKAAADKLAADRAHALAIKLEADAAAQAAEAADFQAKVDAADAALKAERIAAQITADKIAASNTAKTLVAYGDTITALTAQNKALQTSQNRIAEYVDLLERATTTVAVDSTSTGSITTYGDATIRFVLPIPEVYVAMDLTNVYAETYAGTVEYRHTPSTVVEATLSNAGYVDVNVPVTATDKVINLMYRGVVDSNTVEIKQIGVVHLA